MGWVRVFNLDPKTGRTISLNFSMRLASDKTFYMGAGAKKLHRNMCVACNIRENKNSVATLENHNCNKTKSQPQHQKKIVSTSYLNKKKHSFMQHFETNSPHVKHQELVVATSCRWVYLQHSCTSMASVTSKNICRKHTMEYPPERLSSARHMSTAMRCPLGIFSTPWREPWGKSGFELELGW